MGAWRQRSRGGGSTGVRRARLTARAAPRRRGGARCRRCAATAPTSSRWRRSRTRAAWRPTAAPGGAAPWLPRCPPPRGDQRPPPGRAVRAADRPRGARLCAPAGCAACMRGGRQRAPCGQRRGRSPVGVLRCPRPPLARPAQPYPCPPRRRLPGHVSARRAERAARRVTASVRRLPRALRARRPARSLSERARARGRCAWCAAAAATLRARRAATWSTRAARRAWSASPTSAAWPTCRRARAAPGLGLVPGLESASPTSAAWPTCRRARAACWPLRLGQGQGRG